MVIRYRVEFTDGSVVDLQSLSFRFNSYLTLRELFNNREYIGFTYYIKPVIICNKIKIKTKF